MSSRPDARPDGPEADAEVQESVEPSGLRVRARQSLRVPSVLVRLAKRDPLHIPERLTIYTVDRHADEARVWPSERATPHWIAPQRYSPTTSGGARSAPVGSSMGRSQGRHSLSLWCPPTSPFRQDVRFHLRVAALQGTTRPIRVAADFLILRGVHKDPELALVDLEVVRATPLPLPVNTRR